MPAQSAVLFVCLGNICRSPMAEGAMRAEIERQGAAVAVDSAGTGGWHVGEPPDHRAQAIAAQNGVDISGLRARQVTAADFDRFGHIIAMDRANLDNLAKLRPASSGAVLSLLLDHVPGSEGGSIGDPYYGGPEGFSRAWAEVTAGAAGLLAKITM